MTYRSPKYVCIVPIVVTELEFRDIEARSPH